MLVVTNRNIENIDSGNETTFGEGVNVKGPSELRVAWAEFVDNRWKVNLIDELPDIRERPEEELPSSRAFKEFRDLLIDSGKDCVFFIHGYNREFLESLQQAREIELRYNLEVVVFSWPADPGGFIGLDYRQAQAIAKNSVVALDRIFERMEKLVRLHIRDRCESSFNLLIHSLGNYIFEHLVRKPIFTGETRFFDNIVLNAPDVDSETHTEWVDKLRFSRRVYVTINERDKVLDASDIINSDRLGNTARNLTGERAVYLDFTEGEGVDKNHAHFNESAEKNANVLEFFHLALHGKAAAPGVGLQLKEDTTNTYVLE